MLSLVCTQTVSLLDSPSNSNYFAAVRIYSVEFYLTYIISKCPSQSGLKREKSRHPRHSNRVAWTKWIPKQPRINDFRVWIPLLKLKKTTVLLIPRVRHQEKENATTTTLSMMSNERNRQNWRLKTAWLNMTKDLGRNIAHVYS